MLGPADLSATVARLIDLYGKGTISRDDLTEVLGVMCSAYVEETVERRVEELVARALNRGFNARLATLPNG